MNRHNSKNSKKTEPSESSQRTILGCFSRNTYVLIQNIYSTAFRIQLCSICTLKRRFTEKIQNIEVQAIKIAYRLAPWATNTSCYKLTNFPKITERLKTLARKFVTDNKEDDMIEPLIKNVKPSMTGNHSPLYKAINF